LTKSALCLQPAPNETSNPAFTSFGQHSRGHPIHKRFQELGDCGLCGRRLSCCG
jgi:hypothetical protein